MAIQQPAELAAKEKKIRLLIAGPPGIGKTSLALSAPNPLLIDVDRGLDRVAAMYRKPFIQPAKYEEILADLTPVNMKGFDTLVFDTGGQLIKTMTPWAIRQNDKNGQRDGSLSLKGYGAVGREFERLMNHCYYELDKNIVVVFHSKEEKDSDNTRLRLHVEGQTKDNVYQPMDLAGQMEIIGTNRVLSFSPSERYFAKGTHGITGSMTIPELTAGMPNDFLTKLFDDVNGSIKAEAADVEVERRLYEDVMMGARDVVSEINTPEQADEAVKYFKNLPHYLTSEREIRSMFAKRVKELGFKIDRKTGRYVVKEVA